MNEATFGLLALLVLLALFLTGIELAFAMGIIGFLGFALLNGFDPAVSSWRMIFLIPWRLMALLRYLFLSSWDRSHLMRALQSACTTQTTNSSGTFRADLLWPP